MTPLVSIIIPVAPSHQHYLKHALYSVEQSTFKEYEVITVDGSQGTSHARNTGVKQSSCPLLLFLDADDLLINTALEAMFTAYVEQDAAYVYGDWYELNRKATELRFKPAKPYQREEQLKKNLHLVTTLLERSAFEAVNGFDETFTAWEDWDLYTRLALNGYCGYHVSSPILIYRRSSSINRVTHDVIGSAVHEQLLLGELQGYIQGTKSFMSCSCNQTKPVKPQSISTQNTVQLEFIGTQQAPIRFTLRDRTMIVAARNGTQQFHWLPQPHAEELMERFPRLWKVLAHTTQAPHIPSVAEVAIQ